MGTPKNSLPSVFVAAIFSRHSDALEWARERAKREWGAIFKASQPFSFDETDYYSKEMGDGLSKQFLLFEGMFEPEELSIRKLASNAWEEEYRALGVHDEERPLNIDPGYVVVNKLVLASTKDRAHRIYIGHGIFAEVTMRYVGGWQEYPWTYPDYMRSSSMEFFSDCRQYLNSLVRAARDSNSSNSHPSSSS